MANTSHKPHKAGRTSLWLTETDRVAIAYLRNDHPTGWAGVSDSLLIRGCIRSVVSGLDIGASMSRLVQEDGRTTRHQI